MITTTCNGIQLEWDDTISVGQLITSYDSGYHVVTSIEQRENKPPLFNYVRVDGRRRQSSCDASFCRKATAEMIERERVEAVNAANRKANDMLGYLSKA